MGEQTRGTVEMSVAMAVSGTIGWFVVTSRRPVLDVVFWRSVFGVVALLATCMSMGLLRHHLTRRVLALSALGGVAIVLNWVLLFGAYSRASIAIATTVYNTQPFMLVCLGAFFLGERVTLAKLGWLGVAFGGLALIVQVGATTASLGAGYTVGILMALGAAALWAIAALVTKQLAGTPPHLIALIHVSVGVVMLAPFASWAHPPAQAAAWSILVIIGVVHTGVVYILMYDAIHRLPLTSRGRFPSSIRSWPSRWMWWHSGGGLRRCKWSARWRFWWR
jgi:drug/metabolite transporter (DMT)-like permease